MLALFRLAAALVLLVLRVRAAAPLPADEDLSTFGWSAFRFGVSPFNGSVSPASLVPLWSAKIGGVSDAQPLVLTLGSTRCAIVVSEGGYVLSFELFTGKLNWKTKIGAFKTKTCMDLGPNGSWGVGGTPVFDAQKNLLYAVNGPGVLFALHVSNGKVAWKKKLVDGKLLHNYGALNLIDRRVYVTWVFFCRRSLPKAAANLSI